MYDTFLFRPVVNFVFRLDFFSLGAVLMEVVVALRHFLLFLYSFLRCLCSVCFYFVKLYFIRQAVENNILIYRNSLE